MLTLSLALPPDVHAALVDAARETGQTPETLAIDAITDLLETAIRYKTVVERMSRVDQALLDLGALLGETAAAADLARGEGGVPEICRYQPGKS